MPRDYPPMSNAVALGQARAAATAWNGAYPRPGNTGNQETEYITFGQAETVKDAWRAQGTLTVNGVDYNCVASNSHSGLGNEIDLKLRAPGHDASAFNYHIRLDAQTVVRQRDQAQLNVMRDNWRIVNNLRREEYRDRNGHNPPASYDLPFPFR